MNQHFNIFLQNQRILVKSKVFFVLIEYEPETTKIKRLKSMRSPERPVKPQKNTLGTEENLDDRAMARLKENPYRKSVTFADQPELQIIDSVEVESDTKSKRIKDRNKSRLGCLKCWR